MPQIYLFITYIYILIYLFIKVKIRKFVQRKEIHRASHHIYDIFHIYLFIFFF